MSGNKTRRDMLKGIAASGMLAALGKQVEAAVKTTAPSTTENATLTVNDLASVLGHPYSREERGRLRDGVGRNSWWG